MDYYMTCPLPSAYSSPPQTPRPGWLSHHVYRPTKIVSDLISLASDKVVDFFEDDAWTGRRRQLMNRVYPLPADDKEIDRLSKQNNMLFYRNGCNYCAPVNEVLSAAYRSGRGMPTVLDVGCAGGEWPIAMAREFPWVVVLGVDFVPVQRSETFVPQNCSFEMVDVSNELPWDRDSYDIIHVRDLNYGCQHYDNHIARLSSLLRPGGIIILNEPEMAWREFDDKVDPCIPQFWNYVRKELKDRHIDTEVPLKLYPALYQAGVQFGGWHKIAHNEWSLPIGDHIQNDERLIYSGALHLEAAQTFIDSCESLLLTAGLSREEYAYMQWKVKDALCEPGTRYYARWFHCWAQRPTI